MKVLAVYNAWSDCKDLLFKSLQNIMPVVDEALVVYSDMSNRKNFIEFAFPPLNKTTLLRHEPNFNLTPHDNETAKRNIGVEYAKRNGFTHLIMMDCDEFYLRSDVSRETERMKIHPEINALVCGVRVYIKEPTLYCDDHTLVPFIVKVTDDLHFGNYKHFPFTYDKQRNCHIDPTRRPSYRQGVEWSDAIMHHFSYVRQNMDLKIENSSANLSRSREVIYEDLAKAEPGYESKMYHQYLKQCEDIFKIKEEVTA